jgi:dolichyl-phosphate-mannose--protein O-mannosyl transferase
MRFVIPNRIAAPFNRLRQIFRAFAYIFHYITPFFIYLLCMWFIITAASSVALVLFLGLAVLFPLRVRITEEERKEREQHHKIRRRPPVQKYRDNFDDELYFDDDEL